MSYSRSTMASVGANAGFHPIFVLLAKIPGLFYSRSLALSRKYPARRMERYARIHMFSLNLSEALRKRRESDGSTARDPDATDGDARSHRRPDSAREADGFSRPRAGGSPADWRVHPRIQLHGFQPAPGHRNLRAREAVVQKRG